MNSDGQEFGILLRACRQTAGLSQEELAERSGLSLRSISNLERGRTRWPYRETLHRLADALELHDAARAVFIGAAGRRLAAITGVLGASPARDQSRPADGPLVPPPPVPAPGILPGGAGQSGRRSGQRNRRNYRYLGYRGNSGGREDSAGVLMGAFRRARIRRWPALREPQRLRPVRDSGQRG